MRRVLRGSAAFWVPAVIAVLVPAITADQYFLHVAILVMLNSLLAISLMPLLRSGLINVAHASFWAIGAYSSALLTMRAGFSFWPSMVCAGVIAAASAAAIGLATLRIRGLFFMLVTFSFATFFQLALSYWRALTGGPDGLVGIPAPDPIRLPYGVHVDFSTKISYYYLIVALTAAAMFLVYRLWMSKLGRICRAMAENERLIQSLGVSPMKYKLLLFCTMTFLAGIAGSFYAHYLRFLGPQDFDVWASITMLIYVQVGGVFSFFGPLIGAVSLTIVSEFLRFAGPWQPILFGGLLIAVSLFAPEGMVGIGRRMTERIGNRWRYWKRPA